MKRFTEATHRTLGRKVTTNMAPRASLHGELLGPVDLVFFDGSDSGLEALCAERESSGADPDFLARDLATGDVFMVATEGYRYPRYLGRLSHCDADRAVLRCGGPKR